MQSLPDITVYYLVYRLYRAISAVTRIPLAMNRLQREWMVGYLEKRRKLLNDPVLPKIAVG